jgi:hypothetical protein
MCTALLRHGLAGRVVEKFLAAPDGLAVDGHDVEAQARGFERLAPLGAADVREEHAAQTIFVVEAGEQAG